MCRNKEKIRSIPQIASYNVNKKKMMVRNKIMENIRNGKKNNLVIGSGHSLGYIDKNFPDFISTDQDELDLINRFEITQYIPKESISIIFANHVLEHIYPEFVWSVFENIHYMNIIGGYLVLCVPDLNSFKSQYFNTKEQAILFQPKAAHYVYYTFESLKYILNDIGYEVTPLYYHNKNGEAIENINEYYKLEKLNLKKIIQASIKSDMYGVCVKCKKLKY